jgi:ABC-type glycerol-3-phosphate transport system permease component
MATNKRYRDKQKRKDAFISIFIGFFAFVWIFPILWTVWTSLRPYNEIISYGIFSRPRSLNFDNYVFNLSCVKRTLPDKERYLQHIAKYADSSARSKVANAVRRGAAAHEIDDEKDTY